MDAELERYIEAASDPRLISGIYNYCHRRCPQCPFTDRCLTFRHMRNDAAQHPERGVLEEVAHNVERTVDLLKAWCEREGIDFEQLHEEAAAEGRTAEFARLEHEMDTDPLHVLAFTYTKAAFDLVSGLERLAPFHEWSPAVREALETIGWYASLISTKVGRALYGLAERNPDGDNEDPIQNDWNGSAKVARMAIAESQRAWDTLLLVGQAPPDAPLRQTRALLDRIDAAVETRFPRAMDFVRPGFDEPEIAAGALSTLACYEPRPQRSERGVVAWLQRLSGRWQRRS
jgi:hypothetical protein